MGGHYPSGVDGSGLPLEFVRSHLARYSRPAFDSDATSKRVRQDDFRVPMTVRLWLTTDSASKAMNDSGISWLQYPYTSTLQVHSFLGLLHFPMIVQHMIAARQPLTRKGQAAWLS
jgi:hypothetical protein